MPATTREELVESSPLIRGGVPPKHRRELYAGCVNTDELGQLSLT